MQPCIAYMACVAGGEGGEGITVPRALPDIYLEKLLSVCECAGVYIGTCIAKHITGMWLSCCIHVYMLALCMSGLAS